MAHRTSHPVRPFFCFSVSKKIALAAALLCSYASAATYYVSPSGSDSNPGSYSQPFRTVSKGAGIARPGDTIVLRDGTYGNEGNISDGTGGWYGYAAPVKIWTAGSSSAWITLKAEHKGKAILDCGTTTSVMGCDKYITLYAGAAYWSFEDLVFTRGAFGGIGTDDGASHIRIKGNRFEYIGYWNDPTQIGEDGVGFNKAASDWWIEGNVFHDIGRTGTAILDHGIYAGGSNATVINNVFYNIMDGWAIQLSDGATNWMIANNTFAFPHPSQSGHIMLWNTNNSITIRNNIFYNPGSYAIERYASQVNGCYVDHNLIIGASSVMSDSSGCSVNSNQMSGDPRFANVSAYDFHVQAGGTGVEAGMNLSQVTEDFDQVRRPQGASTDLGAYELSSQQGPVITGVFVSSILADSAVVNWSTDKPASSYVEYGVGGYSAKTAEDSNLTTIHSVALVNLSAGTQYQFRVGSRDSAGTLTVSGDQSFVTLASALPSFALSATPASLTVGGGQTSATTVSAILLSGNPGVVTFAASSVPGGVTAAFSPSACSPGCSTNLQLSVSSAAAPGTYQITVAGSGTNSSASTTVALTIPAPPQPTPSTNADTWSGLAALWDFNEGHGNRTADLSGNGNTARLNHTSWSQSGCSGCVWLNGDSSYLSVDESASLELTSRLTVAMWLKVGASGGVDPRIITKRYDWGVKLNGSGRYPQFSAGSGYAMLNKSLPEDTWQHVVFTFSSGTVKGYVNGQPIAFAQNTFSGSASLPSYQYGMFLGTLGDGTSFFNGMLDDIRVYGRVLSDADVAALYQETRH